MKRISASLVAISVILLGIVAISTAFAGNPHFVGNTKIEEDGNTLVVSGKIAGLGNEEQIHVEVMATAECINPGGQNPQAANKETVSAEGDFPVQNGKAQFELTLEAIFQPDCTPPMTLEWSDVTITADGLTYP